MKFNRKLIASLLATALILGQCSLASAASMEANYSEATYYDIATTTYSRMIAYEYGALVVANLDKQYGLMDPQGNMIVDYQYDSLKSIGNGFYIAELYDAETYTRVYGVLNSAGEEVYPLISSYISVWTDRIAIRVESEDENSWFGGSYEYYDMYMNPMVEETTSYTEVTIPGFDRVQTSYQGDYYIAYNVDDSWIWTSAAVYDFDLNVVIPAGSYTGISVICDADGEAYFVLKTVDGVSLVDSNNQTILASGLYTNIYQSWTAPDYLQVTTADGTTGLMTMDGSVVVALGDYANFGGMNEDGYITAQTIERDDSYQVVSTSTDLYKDGTLVQTYADKLVTTAVYYRDLAFSLDGGETHGMMTVDGTVLLDAQFSAINPGVNGDYITAKAVEDSWEKLYGLYTVDCTKLLDTVYSDLSALSQDGIYQVYDGTYYGIYKTASQSFTIPLQYVSMRINTLNFIELYDGSQYTLVNTDNQKMTLPDEEAPMLYDGSGSQWYFSSDISKFLGNAQSVDGYDSYVAPVVHGDTTYYIDVANGRAFGSLDGQASNVNADGNFVYTDASGNMGFASTTGAYWTDQIAYESNVSVMLDGEAMTFAAYALLDEAGNATNYVKIRDVADVLNGTQGQFNVTWDGAVNIVDGTAYTTNGTEGYTPYDGNQIYQVATADTKIDGTVSEVEAIILYDTYGNGYTYYKLRDLGQNLGFNVAWDSVNSCILVESDQPYTG